MPAFHVDPELEAAIMSGIAARDELPSPRLSHTQRLWLPGDFPSNNELRDLSQQEGFNRGLRQYERARAKRQTPIFRPYSNRIASIRAMTMARARAARLVPIPVERWVRLAFFLMGHPRYDADAWYGAAKPVADGLQDAGVICRDGADVHSTEGRCVRSVEEAATIRFPAGGWKGDPAELVGMMVEVSPWG
jgi:hypothetical protein